MQPSSPIDFAQSQLDALAAQRPAGESLKILDAGCGRRSVVSYPETSHVTGVDVSADALASNARLDERLVADLESLDLPAGHFDVVVCWDVLEHLPRPRRALEALVAAVAPGGLMILGLPNLLSGKGLVTKLTPLRFHVWFYRHVRKSTEAGKPGYGPFKTYLRMSLAPPALRRHLIRSGVLIERLELYEGGLLQRMREETGFLPGIARTAWQGLTAVMRIVTLKRMNPALTEMLVLARRPEAVTISGSAEPSASRRG